MRLTPPTLPVFLIALVLGALSIASHYTHIPAIGHYVVAHQYWILVAAFAIMTLGVLLPGL